MITTLTFGAPLVSNPRFAAPTDHEFGVVLKVNVGKTFVFADEAAT